MKIGGIIPLFYYFLEDFKFNVRNTLQKNVPPVKQGNWLKHFNQLHKNPIEKYTSVQARSQPVFSGKPEGLFCLSCTFIFRNDRNRMTKSARVSEKLASPGLPGLQVATRLRYITKCLI